MKRINFSVFKNVVLLNLLNLLIAISLMSCGSETEENSGTGPESSNAQALENKSLKLKMDQLHGEWLFRQNGVGAVNEYTYVFQEHSMTIRYLHENGLMAEKTMGYKIREEIELDFFYPDTTSTREKGTIISYFLHDETKLVYTAFLLKDNALYLARAERGIRFKRSSRKKRKILQFY